LLMIGLSVPGFGQINLKLPKIPKIPKLPGSPTGDGSPARLPTSGGKTSSVKRSNRQLVIDDGFTFFDAEPLQEYSAQARRQVGIGWHLGSKLRMFGTVPNRSGFKLVVSKAGREIVMIRCEGTAYRKAENPVPEY